MCSLSDEGKAALLRVYKCVHDVDYPKRGIRLTSHEAGSIGMTSDARSVHIERTGTCVGWDQKKHDLVFKMVWDAFENDKSVYIPAGLVEYLYNEERLMEVCAEFRLCTWCCSRKVPIGYFKKRQAELDETDEWSFDDIDPWVDHPDRVSLLRQCKADLGFFIWRVYTTTKHQGAYRCVTCSDEWEEDNVGPL